MANLFGLEESRGYSIRVGEAQDCDASRCEQHEDGRSSYAAT